MAVVGSGQSTNTEIREAAVRIAEVCQIALKRAAQSALGTPGVTLPPGSLEEAAQGGLTRELPQNRNRVRRLAGRTRKGQNQLSPLRPPVTSTLLSFDSTRSVFEQAEQAGAFKGLTLERTLAEFRTGTDLSRLPAPPTDPRQYRAWLRRAVPLALDTTKVTSRGLGSIVGLPRFESLDTSPAQTPRAATFLQLKLDKVTAVRRFGIEITDFAADEILCGGDAQDSVLPQPTHVKVAPLNVGKFFEDGQVRNLKPDLVFAQFALNGNDWPRSWSADIFLAQSDASGAFLEFLRKVWDLIGKDVIALATELALAAAGLTAGAAVGAATTGAAAGAAAGTPAGPIVGSIVGAIVGAVIGALAAWILSSLEDDIFETPGLVFAALAGPTDRFDGELRSPTYTQQFAKGHALYIVDYYWQLVE